MTDPSLDHVHVFEPATTPGLPTLLMLHGTGGNEHDLVPFGQALLPGAAILSPRGKVLERGMPRFFRRFAEGVFDFDDLRQRTGELADFVAAAARHYGFDPNLVIGGGFSNGASTSDSPNVSGDSSIAKPGPSVASSNSAPPGSLKYTDLNQKRSIIGVGSAPAASTRVRTSR